MLKADYLISVFLRVVCGVCVGVLVVCVFLFLLFSLGSVVMHLVCCSLYFSCR